MTAPQNLEQEASKFLFKLIQESKDEPKELARKLSVILHFMKLSGKENSRPFKMVSRAMEFICVQHGLDAEGLKSLSLPSAGGTNVGGSSSSQSTGNVELASEVHPVPTNPFGTSHSSDSATYIMNSISSLLLGSGLPGLVTPPPGFDIFGCQPAPEIPDTGPGRDRGKRPEEEINDQKKETGGSERLDDMAMASKRGSER